MEIEELIVATDFELVQQFIDKGDNHAFSHLFARYREAIMQFYMQRTQGNVENSRDLLQETFIKVFLNIGRYNPRFTFGQWIYTIARNTFIDYVRKRRDEFMVERYPVGEMQSSTPVSTVASPEESFIKSQQRNRIEECLSKLPVKYRTLIELRFYKEYSYEEIATELNIPIGTVKTQIHRARGRLCRLITEGDELR